MSSTSEQYNEHVDYEVEERDLEEETPIDVEDVDESDDIVEVGGKRKGGKRKGGPLMRGQSRGREGLPPLKRGQGKGRALTHLRNDLNNYPVRRAKNLASIDPTQTTLNLIKKEDGLTTIGTWQYNHAQVRKAIAEMIIVHGYPLSMVEHVYFRKMMSVSQPLFKPFSRETVRSDIIKMHKDETVRLKELLLANKGKIGLTTDMWTSSTQQRGYMAVTAHFIDDNWKLQNLILRFVYVPSPHNFYVLSDSMIECVNDIWGIGNQLSAITLDNVSANDAMVSKLLSKLDRSSLILDGRLFHMHCFAHVLHLIVKDSLEMIGPSIERVRDSVLYWTSTPRRWQDFDEIRKKECGASDTKKLVLDVKTRWNSTYLMLVTVLPYKTVFSRLAKDHPFYTSVPTDEDWRAVRDICDKLKVFFQMTEMFSGTKYPTANLFFSKVCKIKLEISKWWLYDDDLIRGMTSKMEAKFLKYWDVTYGIFSVAAFLDPRCKMNVIIYWLKRIYGDDHEVEVLNVRKLINEIVDNYKRKNPYLVSEDAPSNQSVSDSQSAIPSDCIDPDEEFFADVIRSGAIKPPKTEVDLYLDDGLVPTPIVRSEFDVLLWWKTNGLKYPVLCAMARDFLAIPATSIASESAFNTCGRVLESYRSQLGEDVIEALMCCQSWLRGNIQDSSGFLTIQDDKDADETVLHCMPFPP